MDEGDQESRGAQELAIQRILEITCELQSDGAEFYASKVGTFHSEEVIQTYSSSRGEGEE